MALTQRGINIPVTGQFQDGDDIVDALIAQGLSVDSAIGSAIAAAVNEANNYTDEAIGNIGGTGGVTDHGALTGLSDDDHPQYHNDARGDARYYTKTQVDDALSGKSNTGHTHSTDDITGLADVATSGSYDDLDDKPSIPSTPGDIGAAAASHSHTADHISDATNVGKGVLTAADAAAARSAIGAGTSSLSIGTTDSTAAAGNRGLPAGGTEGQVLAKASGSNYDTEWVDPPEGGGGGGGVAPHAMTGRWHQGMVKGNIGNSNVSITGGTLYCLPAWSDGETIDAVWIRISTDSPSVTVRLGFYAVRADGRPGDLIADIGTINGASGVRTVMVNPALTLPRGPYFRVLVADNAETFNVYGMSSSGIVDPRNWLGAQSGDQSPNTAGGVAYTGYDSTAPLPASATTAGESFLALNHVPAITVRAA